VTNDRKTTRAIDGNSAQAIDTVDTGLLSPAKRKHNDTPIATSTPGPATARAFFMRGPHNNT
jgi:hypothetical protein